METEQPTQETPVVQPAEESKQEVPISAEAQPKEKSIWIVLLNIFLILIVILLLLYIAYKNGYLDLDKYLGDKTPISDEQDGDEQEEEVPEDTAEAVLDEYEGEIISATIPEGWDIIEYFNGEGSDMLVSEVTYSGLTGLQILKDDDEVFKLEAVSGIGFVGCPELPIFPDSSDAYLTEQEEINEEVQIEMTTLDYTNTDYSNFEWLGRDFRRVDNTLYYDTVLNNNFFEPQCETILVTLPGVTFEDSYGYEGRAYIYEISTNATAEELEILDEILTSMTLN